MLRSLLVGIIGSPSSDLLISFARSVVSYFLVGMSEERHHVRVVCLVALTLLSRQKADKKTLFLRMLFYFYKNIAWQ